MTRSCTGSWSTTPADFSRSFRNGREKNRPYAGDKIASATISSRLATATTPAEVPVWVVP